MSARPLILSVNLTTSCNLACSYCHAIKRRAALSERDLQGVLDALPGLGGQPLQVVPFGGEPLVAWPALKRLVSGAWERGVRSFLLCTNGLLLTPERLAFLDAHGVEVTLSWDGVPPAQDRLRVYRGGGGTSADVEPVFDLLARSRLRPQVRVTVAPETARWFAASVRHAFSRLARRGVKVCFMPVAAAPWSAAQLGQLDSGIAGAAAALIEARRAGVDAALAYNECLPAHELGAQLLFDERPGARACLWGEKMLGVDADGGLYPCHTALELAPELQKRLRLGHARDGLARRAQAAPARENAYHCCWSWNLVAGGEPGLVAPVYETAFRAALRESVRIVRALEPALAARAPARAALLLARARAQTRALTAPPASTARAGRRTRPAPPRAPRRRKSAAAPRPRP